MTMHVTWPLVWDPTIRAFRPVVDVLPDLDHWPDVTCMDQRETTHPAPDRG